MYPYMSTGAQFASAGCHGWSRSGQAYCMCHCFLFSSAVCAVSSFVFALEAATACLSPVGLSCTHETLGSCWLCYTWTHLKKKMKQLIKWAALRKERTAVFLNEWLLFPMALGITPCNSKILGNKCSQRGLMGLPEVSDMHLETFYHGPGSFPRYLYSS